MELKRQATKCALRVHNGPTLISSLLPGGPESEIRAERLVSIWDGSIASLEGNHVKTKEYSSRRSEPVNIYVFAISTTCRTAHPLTHSR